MLDDICFNFCLINSNVPRLILCACSHRSRLCRLTFSLEKRNDWAKEPVYLLSNPSNFVIGFLYFDKGFLCLLVKFAPLPDVLHQGDSSQCNGERHDASQLQHQRHQHANDCRAAADQDLLNAFQASVDAVVAKLADLFVRIQSCFYGCHTATSTQDNVGSSQE